MSKELDDELNDPGNEDPGSLMDDAEVPLNDLDEAADGGNTENQLEVDVFLGPAVQRHLLAHHAVIDQRLRLIAADIDHCAALASDHIHHIHPMLGQSCQVVGMGQVFAQFILTLLACGHAACLRQVLLRISQALAFLKQSLGDVFH